MTEPNADVPRATVRITDLALRTIIGFNEWERKKRQDIVVNLSFDFDPRPAIASDAVADTVDYKQVKRSIIELVESSEFLLVEKLAHAILSCVIARPRVLSATVRVDKPHALRFATSVSVEMSSEKYT